MAAEERLEFSSNPADYNRVLCLVCSSNVKVHHMKKHLQSHEGMTLSQYKETFGEDWIYVKKFHHRCGICQQALLFDLETLYHHLTSNHKIKVKEYIDMYIGPIGTLCETVRPVLSSTARPGSSSPSPRPAKVMKVEREDSEPGQDLMMNCYRTATLERIQEIAEDGNLISNDLADYTEVECSICNIHLPMTRLRSHTKTVHRVAITEYKAMFGASLTPLAVVWHRCGVCGMLVMLDSDHIAVHLKSGGHPRITHKDYNEAFMVDTRSTKHYNKRSSDREQDFVQQLQREESRTEEVGEPSRVKRKPRVAYEEGDYDIGKVLENSTRDIPDPQVIIETVTEDEESSNNVIKRLQLNSSDKKLEVIMLN